MTMRAKALIASGLCLASLLQEQVALASCSGSACNGKDPQVERCDVDVKDGPSTRVWFYVTVVLRYTTACGGVKWAKAYTRYSCAPNTFYVVLRDADNRELPGTRYTDDGSSPSEIFGQMWSGPAKACASICGDPEVCTDLDP